MPKVNTKYREARGFKRPGENNIYFTFRIPTDLFASCNEQAKAQNISLNSFLVSAVRKGIKNV